MDKLKSKIAEYTGRTEADIDELTKALIEVIRDTASSLDNIAIPTFGTFVSEKHNEEVRTDLSTGHKMLLPPEIVLTFNPGAMLLKKLRNE